MTFLYVLILITLFLVVPIGSFFLVRHIDRLERAAEAPEAEAGKPADTEVVETEEADLSLDKSA